MSFTISSGCATFNAYNASCNVNLTFCKTSSQSSYRIVDAKTLKVVEEGTFEGLVKTSKHLSELPAGSYIITLDGNSTSVMSSMKCR
jgi:hypothetical protein